MGKNLRDGRAHMTAQHADMVVQVTTSVTYSVGYGMDKPQLGDILVDKIADLKPGEELTVTRQA